MLQIILSLMELFRDNETNNSNRTWHASQLVWDEPVGYFANVAEDLNSRLQGKNPASGQGGTWIWGLRITGPAPQPLGHEYKLL